MKKSIACLLIIMHLLVLSAQNFANVTSDSMRITKIIDNVMAANQGIVHGIEKDTVYSIQRETDAGMMDIGIARVIFVKEEVCALSIVSVHEGMQVQPGDVLVSSNDLSSEEWVMLEAQEAQDSKDTQISTPTVPNVNYYKQGRDTAKSDYSSGGMVVGGLLAGFGLGLIGWGIGYIIIANQGVKVPQAYTADLPEQSQQDFDSGYSDQVKSKRKSAFNMGAIIGVVGAVIFIASLEGSDSN